MIIDPIFEQLYNEHVTEEHKEYVSLCTDISMRVHDLLKEREMSQKDLAEKLGKRPSEINKWLKSGHNLTLKTIAKLQTVLKEDIIHVPAKKFIGIDKSKSFHKERAFVVYRNSKVDLKSISQSSLISSVSIKNKSITKQGVA